MFRGLRGAQGELLLTTLWCGSVGMKDAVCMCYLVCKLFCIELCVNYSVDCFVSLQVSC